MTGRELFSTPGPVTIFDPYRTPCLLRAYPHKFPSDQPMRLPEIVLLPDQ